MTLVEPGTLEAPSVVNLAHSDSAPLLAVDGLSIAYRQGRTWTPTVHDVSFDLRAGQTLAVVGQSGSGKSTMANAILRLLPDHQARTTGSVAFAGHDLLSMPLREFRRIRAHDIAFVPQDPSHALNPVRTIGSQVREAIAFASEDPGARIPHSVVTELLDRVGIPSPDRVAGLYPHELSGGMLQRVLIAAAFAGTPRLIVADEPTSALDVTVQRTILDLLDGIQASTDVGILLITHDLSIASDRADRILLLSDGLVQEQGDARQVLAEPASPYTRALLADVPSRDPDRYREAKRSVVLDPSDHVVSFTNVSRRFGHGDHALQALDAVTFSLARGATHALVGESGSGKSTLARILLGLERPDTGVVEVDGQAMADLGRAGWRELRRRVQFVYQNPFTSLDPSLTVASIIGEPLRRLRICGRAERARRVGELAEAVGLQKHHLKVKPSSLSGGQRQRVAIARALAPDPEVLVLDEPTSALDVSVQARILDLLDGIQRERHLTLFFISHDLGVVRQFADDVTVLRHGVVVESGQAEEIFAHPRHEYTRALLASIPGGGPILPPLALPVR